MRNLITLCLLISLAACHTATEQEKLHKTIEGDWIVLYADHKLNNKKERQVYGPIQDSIIEAKSLKLVRFLKDGSFEQVEYPGQKGKWAVSETKDVYIGNGKWGFEDFRSKYLEFENEKLQLREDVSANGESIKLVWILKKLDHAELTKPESNAWRKKAGKQESEKELRQRLGIILEYYSTYFKLVATESAFFIAKRVILPFQFYQHAMGLLQYNPESEFAGLFYSNEQAEQAYGYLNSTISKLSNKYPNADNYVEEYSKYMKLLADAIK